MWPESERQEQSMQEALRRMKYTPEDIRLMPMSEYTRFRSELERVRNEMLTESRFRSELESLRHQAEFHQSPTMACCMWCGQLFPPGQVDEHEDSCSG